MQNFPDIRNALDFSRSFLFLCGLFRFISVAAGGLHFPMQKREKMVERRSGVVMEPVMVERWWMASRKSCATRSSGRLKDIAERGVFGVEEGKEVVEAGERDARTRSKGAMDCWRA